MLRRMMDMEGYSISATDGIVGQVKDYYFDDETWVIRYLIVETGAWLARRKVLISPAAINRPDWSESTIPAAITQEQVRNSPDIDTDKPVSRQHEIQYLEYYRYPHYWTGLGIWGAGAFPNATQRGLGSGWSGEQYREALDKLDGAKAGRQRNEDPRLRSGNTVIRYHVHATDGDIGHVQGILIDERTWAIHYLIVNTSNWWLGHEVLIAPEWISSVNWADSTVTVDVTRQAIKDAPPYDPAVSLDREHAARIHRHDGRDEYRLREAGYEPAIPHLGP
jgi:sporulation protein YlmC with PRC-barrel domain